MEKAPQDTDSRHADKYIVRFPEGMRARLKAEAALRKRTLNAEIIARLTDSLDRPDAPTDVFNIAEAIHKELSTTVQKSGFTIELKVTRDSDPSEGPYMPSKEEYDATMALITKGKAKKK